MVIQEWKEVRKLFFQKYKNDDTLLGWKSLFLDAKLLYPEIYKLISIILILPLTTVDCERGFSVHKITKNKLRNRLTDENVDSCLRVILEGPPLENFDFEKCYVKWKSDKRYT